MDTPSELIEKAARFIEQQREMYGVFTPTSTLKKERQEDEGTESPDTEEVEQESMDEVENANQVHENKKTDTPNEFSLVEKLQACDTLEDLRKLCEQAEELRTDLEGTNLVFGVGDPNADLMVIGEAPGYNEDQQGEPFVGQAGQLLDKIMEAIQFSRENIYIANILKHRPPNNRDPKPEERMRSLPFLLRQIEIVDPKLILCVGRVAATTLLKEDATLKSMRKQFHDFHGRELMVTYHPAALLRNQQWKRPTWEDVQLLRKRYDELGGKS